MEDIEEIVQALLERVKVLEQRAHIEEGEQSGENVLCLMNPSESDSNEWSEECEELNVMEEHFMRLEERIDSIQQDISAILQVQKTSAAKVHSCEASLKDMEKQMDAIKENMSDIQELQKTAEAKFDCFEVSLKVVENQEKQSVVKLTKVETDLQSTQAEINDRFMRVSKDLQSTQTDIHDKFMKVSKDLQSTQTDVNDRFMKVTKDLQSTQIDANDRLMKVYKDFQKMQTDIRDKFMMVSKDLQSSETDIKTMLQKMDSLQQNVTAKEKMQKTSEARVDRCEASLEVMESQVEQNKTAMSTIRSNQDTTKRPAFFVRLDKAGELTEGPLTRLDHCCHVYVDSPYLDTTTCLFTAPLDGLYLLNVILTQHNQGRLNIYARVDERDKYYVSSTYVNAGETDEPYDRRAASILLRLSRGQTVGVYVIRTTGQSTVSWCYFSGCLL